MGKKRRYIQRANKFAKKAFNFLDKLDGLRDSTLKSTKLDTVLTEINLIDRGNQTFSVSFEAMGPGDPASTNSLQGDRVTYTIDGVAVNANHIRTFGARTGTAANDRDNFITTAFAPARAGSGGTDVILTSGTHTIEAHVIKEGDTTAVSKKVSKTFQIAPVKLGLAAAANFLTEGNDGDLTIDITKISATAGTGKIGCQPGVETVYSPKQTAGQRNGYKLVVKNSAGTALAIDGSGGTSLTVNQGAGLDNHANILDTALVGDDTLTVTFTPLDASNAPLTAEAIDVSIAIDVA